MEYIRHFGRTTSGCGVGWGVVPSRPHFTGHDWPAPTAPPPPVPRQFLFVATFSTFLLCCVEYDILFANQPFVPERTKVTLPDAILPAGECAESIQANSGIIFLLVMAAIFWLYRLVKVFYSLLGYWEIRSFYTKALKIPSVSAFPTLGFLVLSRVGLD
uniref:Autophagy-related protein 9 n=1 Tax=Pseudonaja textilis TaxID=8673 RepID=A0A670ZK35_PSETE